MSGDPPRIHLLRRDDCPLCDEAEAVLEDLQGEASFTLELVDVDEDAKLRVQYGDRVPVALHEGEELFDLEAGAAGMREAVADAAGEARD